MRIGSRGSALALAQAKLVAGQLGGAEIVVVRTSGDRGSGPSDKSRWVDAIEDALLAGEVDIAVHSAKDVPVALAPGLILLGGPERIAAEDVLCGASTLEQLAQGARVGTASLRRAAQLRAAREDVEVLGLAGNVDTRLRKLAAGEFDAIVLARAGLQRLGSDEPGWGALDPRQFVPAPGQGMLALEARAADEGLHERLAAVLDPASGTCLLAERALALELQASCHTPLGAHARHTDEGRLSLRGWVGLPDGSAWIRDELEGDLEEPEALGARVAARMLAAGAGGLLARAQEIAAVAGA